MPPRFSEGQNEQELTVALNTLIENGWKLDDEQSGVRKTYHLKTYTKVIVSRSLYPELSHIPAESYRIYIT